VREAFMTGMVVDVSASSAHSAGGHALTEIGNSK